MNLPLKYIPWKRVRDWSCKACGACCKKFEVPLRAREFVDLTKLFGEGIVEIRLGKPYLKKIRGICVFQQGRLCTLHPRGIKPRACKIYPFTVRDKGWESAKFTYRGGEYYVYVNPECRGVILGTPTKNLVERIIPEVIELSLTLEKYNKPSQLARTYIYPPQPIFII
jgi:hypothetical protein